MISLPTKYKGYNFRSRTEARWAVFFDAMKIEYLYEYEDFVLPCGKRYLPDFYLPNILGGCHAEVKGKFDYAGLMTCINLSAFTKKKVILLDGVPTFKAYSYLLSVGPHNYGYLNDLTIYEGVFTGQCSKRGEQIISQGDLKDAGENDWSKEYINAVYAARGAQFEFLNQ